MQAALVLKTEESYEIKPSDLWYSDRKSYGPEEVGKSREMHQEQHGFETLNGSGVVTGKLYGGCVESIYDAFTGASFEDEPLVYEKYNIFPTEDEWKEKRPTPLSKHKLIKSSASFGSTPNWRNVAQASNVLDPVRALNLFVSIKIPR